jgi:two-component system chemotaxis response regulator CheY
MARTCLVVDDSRIQRILMRNFMAELGYEVREAENGRDALGQCREAMPTAILLDWNMPVMSGLEFLRQLRLEPGGNAPKVLFCTSENDGAHIAEARSAGADEYMTKPFDRDGLKEKLDLVGL